MNRLRWVLTYVVLGFDRRVDVPFAVWYHSVRKEGGVSRGHGGSSGEAQGLGESVVGRRGRRRRTMRGVRVKEGSPEGPRGRPTGRGQGFGELVFHEPCPPSSLQ